MKIFISSIIAFFMFAVASNAQQIAIVSPNGTTTLAQTLDEAVSEASAGSVIYLPGGGFQINDATKIKKKLTIMGVSHRADADNVDGGTNIGGNLFFEKGSDGSALMGVYLSGNVNIGTSQDSVLNVLVRYCNVNAIDVKNGKCSGLAINQCYMRSTSFFGNCNAKITNCICHSLRSVNSGTIDHNVVTHYYYANSSYYNALHEISNSIITNNILLNAGQIHSGSNCQVMNNMLSGNWGEDCIKVSGWDGIFVGPNNGVKITSNYQLKGQTGKNAGSDGTDVGIYGGTGFSDKALAPIPRIVAKSIPEQTDASGKLKISVTVKAN